MLKPDPITTNYIFILGGSAFSSSRGCRGRDLGGMVNLYNLLLYNAAATFAALLLLSCYYKLLFVSLLMLQDSREDASLRGLAYSLLPWYFYVAVHYTASPSILIQVHKCLECLGLSLAEYARYSHLLYFPLFVFPDRPLQSTLEPRSRRSPMPSMTSSSPLARSSLEVPR